VAGRRARWLRALRAWTTAAACAFVAGGLALAQPAPGADQPAEPAGGGADPAALSVELLGDGRVRLEARGVSRDQALAALAGAAGFEVAEGAGRPASAALGLRLPDATLEDALAEVLRGVPHHLHYEAGPDGAVSLRRVTVGLLPEARPALAARVNGRRNHDGPAGAPARAREEPERSERAAGLADARDEEERTGAIAAMRPEQDLAPLVAALADPSPRVRVAAAGSLGRVELGEDAFRATDALLGALADRDPAVVAAAVAALESVYDVLPDPRIREAVGRLGRPRDARVRAAVDSFREWTEEEP
jgi:hypothetical protein